MEKEELSECTFKCDETKTMNKYVERKREQKKWKDYFSAEQSWKNAKME